MRGGSGLNYTKTVNCWKNISFTWRKIFSKEIKRPACRQAGKKRSGIKTDPKNLFQLLFSARGYDVLLAQSKKSKGMTADPKNLF